MKDAKKENRKNKTPLKFFLLLFIVNYISHFRYFKKFGFYEDDFFNIVFNFNQNLESIIQFVISRSTSWIQGHPLLLLTGVLTYIGDKIGGLSGLYVLAFIIIFINSYLVYRILKKIFPGSEIFAVTGSLCFCLFPSDTTKIMLTHTYFLQMSLMFFFTATLLYLKGWIKTSYIVITLCILSYESPYMVFFGIPLLMGEWNKKFRNEMIRHVSVLSVIIVIIFFIRKFIGDARVGEVVKDTTGTFYKIIASIFIGPAMNFFIFLRVPFITVYDWISLYTPYWSVNIIVISLFCVSVFIWFFYKLKPDTFTENMNPISEEFSELEKDKVENEKEFTVVYFKRIKQIFLTSIILIMLGYALAFTHYPPTEMKGRLTSVHLAATFGCSIAFACLCASIIFISNKYNYRKIAITFISVYLTILVAFQIRIQVDFAKSWEYQKYFWTKVAELCPDMGENTDIFFLNGEDRNFLPWTNYVIYYDHFVLEQIFNFPKEWENKPTLKFFNPGWRDQIQLENDTLKRYVPKGGLLVLKPIPDKNFIILKPDVDKEIVRLDSSFVTIKGKKINLKPKDNTDNLSNLEKGVLYDLMIK